MRIVSQSKRISANFNRVMLIQEGKQICIIRENGARVLLGLYESSERAQEVFQDIHRAYSPVGIIGANLSEREIKQFIGSENVDLKVVMMPAEKDFTLTTYDSIVYYMPEE